MSNVVGILGIEAERHAREDAVRDLWEAHPTVRDLLRDHYPREWERITHCRSSWIAKEHLTKPGEYRVTPRRACHLLPYCLLCVRAEEYRRAFDAYEALHRCTPAGEKPAVVHVVVTAPLTEEGEGWGESARKNHQGFGRIVAKSLEEIYRGQIGAILAYQDFGERPFHKSHPHMDGLVNGWVLREGKPAKLPRLDFESDGSAWARQIITARAQAMRIGAQAGNLNVSERVEDHGAIIKIARYAFREMVNLRQVEYDRATQKVTWLGYKGTAEEYSVKEWKGGFAEYMWRTGQWNDAGKAAYLKVRYGDLAGPRLRTTQRAMGGVAAPHDEFCPCQRCDNWKEVSWALVDKRAREAMTA